MSNDTENTRKPKEFAITRIKLEVDRTLKSDFVVDSVEKAIYLVNDYLAESPNEILMGIAVDVNKNPISCCVLGVGNSDHIDKNHKALFQYVLSSGADRFIVVHNHPSGSLEPSVTDKNTFQELTTIANKLDVGLMDCIIVGNYKNNRAYYSWTENKVITQYEFLKDLKKVKLEKPLEVTDSSNRTPEETESLLAKSKHNSN